MPDSHIPTLKQVSKGMKHLYSTLKSIFAVLIASTVLMTSCKYDDSDLRSEIKNIYDLISQLEDRIDSEVATLTTLINSTTTIADATLNEDGSWTLLLSSGEAVVVNPKTIADAYDADGCITVKEVEGVYYWAIIANGDAILLTDNNGNKVTVVDNTPTFRANNSGKLEFSVDGNNWYLIPEVEGTDAPDFSYIITNVVDSDEAVLIYLASGDVITVKKALEIDFGVAAGKTYVKAGESVTIGIIAENISDLTVISKPEGWRTSLTGKELTITAPTEDKISDGSADGEGVIKIHATAADGKCMVGKLVVSTSKTALIIAVKGDNVTISHNFMDAYGENMTLYFGIEPRSEFSADAIAEAFNSQKTPAFVQTSSNNVETTVKEIYNSVHNPDSMTMEEVPSGTDYVIWAVIKGEDQYYPQYIPYVFSGDEFVYAIYTPPYVDMQTTKVSFNTIDVAIKAGGYDSYQIGTITNVANEAEALDMLQNRWDGFYRGWGDLGNTVSTLNYTGSITSFDSSNNYDTNITPNSGYLAFVLPITDGRAISDYEFSEVQYLFAKSDAITDGGASVITATAEVNFTDVVANLTASEGSIMIYAKFFKADELAKLNNDQAIIAAITEYCTEYNTVSYDNETTVYSPSLKSGEVVTLCAFAVDEDGKRGKLYREEYKTKELESNTSMVITIDESATKVNISSIDVKFSVSGDTPVRYVYTAVDKIGWAINNYEDASSAANYLVLNSSAYGIESIDASDVTNNTITISGLETNTEYRFAMIALDANGAHSLAALYDFTPTLPKYTIVRNSDSRWAATKPSYSINKWYDEDYGAITYSFTVTPTAEAVKCWATITDTEYMPVGVGAMVGIDNLLLATSKDFAYGGSVEFSGEFTSDAVRSYSCAVYFHLTWTDAEGNFYQAVEECVLPTLVAQNDTKWQTTQPTITCDSDADSLVVNYTVTPGENTKKMWVAFIPSINYTQLDYYTHAMVLGIDGSIECSGEYSAQNIADNTEASIYVTWEDNDGNLYMLKKQACF